MGVLIFFSGGAMLGIEALDDELDMRIGMWLLAVLLIIYAIRDIVEFFKQKDEKDTTQPQIEAAKKQDQGD